MNRQWYVKLGKAVRERECLHRTLFLTEVLLLASLAGLGYCAILRPDAFYSTGNLLVQSLLVLGVSTLIFLAVLLGHLIWNWIAMSRLQKTCLRLVLALAASQLPGRLPEP